ncbi:smad nuclear-interacting protein 1 [Sigmodon hispidus]
MRTIHVEDERIGSTRSHQNKSKGELLTVSKKEIHTWAIPTNAGALNESAEDKAQEVIPCPAGNRSKEELVKEKPSFELSGALLKDTNTFRGMVIKYSEPPEARIPKKRWRLYPFKNDEVLTFWVDIAALLTFPSIIPLAQSSMQFSSTGLWSTHELMAQLVIG